MEFKKEFYSSLAVWLFIILLSFGLYFQNLRARDFWEPDEPRFAEVVREMQFRQDYLFPTVNLQPYPNKPPLYYWMAALFSRDQVNEVSARLPSALAGLGGLMVIYLLGTLLFHRGVGFIAALALAVNGRYLWQSQYVQMDMMLAFFVLLSFYLFLLGWKKERKLPILAAYISMGFGVLAKGPLCCILVGIGIFSYFWVYSETENEKILEKIRAFGKKIIFEFWQLHHWMGILLFLFIALSWNLAFFFTSSKQHFWEYFWRQNFGRYFGTFHSHIRPFYFYFVQFPAEFLPYTLFLPALVYWLYQKRNHLPPAIRMLLYWFLLGFLFFSLSKSKLGKYLLPLLPALFVVLAYWISEIQKEKEKVFVWLMEIPFKIFSVLLFSLAIILLFTLGAFLPRFKAFSIVISLFWATMAIYLYRRADQQKWLHLFFAFIVLWIGSTLLTLPRALPFINQYKSARPMAQRIKTILQAYPQKKWVIYGIFRSAFIFYSGHFCLRMDRTDVEKGLAKKDFQLRFREFLEKNPQAFVLTDGHFSTLFPKDIPKRKTLILQRKVGSRLWKFYLFHER